MAKHNYRTGAYVSPFAWDENRDWDITRSNLEDYQVLRGTLDWDSLENVQGHIKDLKTIRKISASKERYFADNPDKDTLIGMLQLALAQVAQAGTFQNRVPHFIALIP